MDLARFLAAFGIVAAHAYAMEEDWVGHIALALFLVLTAFLAMQSFQRAGRYPFWARAQRLVLPWLAWSVFYRIVLLKVNDGPDRFALLTDPWTLLIGGWVHLWFLPFVMMAMALVEPVGRYVTTETRLAAALSLVTLLAVPMIWLSWAYDLPMPLPQWLFSLPLYALGLLLGLAHAMGRPFWPSIAAAVMTLWLYFATDGVPYYWTILGAVLAFELFWRLPLRGDWLPGLGQAAFGIYLMHPFFMLVVYKFAGPEVDHFLATVVVFGLSWAATYALRQIAFFRRVT